MQTVKDYIKASIRHTLKEVGESVLLEDKIFKRFIYVNKIDLTKLNRRAVREVSPPSQEVEVKRVLRTVPIPSEKELKILLTIQEITKIPVTDIISRSRKKEHVDARRIYMTILNIYLNIDLAETGRRTGRDHSTVIHAVRTHDSYMESEAIYRKKFKQIIELLQVAYPEDFTETETPDFKNFNKQLNREKWEKILRYQESKKMKNAKAY